MKRICSRFVLIVVVAFLCVTFLSACKNNKQTEAVTLETPVVTLDGDVAKWSADESADSFEISVNDSLSYIENSVSQYTLTDGQTFKVRAVGNGESYLTSEWSNTVTYNAPPRTYTVLWKVDDTVIESDVNVEFGAMPSYDGGTPQKAKDAQYTYTFSGWTPEFQAVTEDAVYTAVFDTEVNKYTVTWNIHNSVVETDTDVEYGKMPRYDGELPHKDDNERFVYNFIGWAPSIGIVTGDVEYVAVFSETAKQYTITFYDEDGITVLGKSSAEYGGTAEFGGRVPQKAPTDEYQYTFNGWLTAVNGDIKDQLNNVTVDRSVYASYTRSDREYLISFEPNDATYGSVSKSSVKAKRGVPIIVNGNTVSIAGTEISANPAANTAQYSYGFSNWEGVSQTVFADMEIKAVFSRTLKTYTVKWMDGESELEKDENVPYGDMPTYNGEYPVKDINGTRYIFNGWEPQIEKVTGHAEYRAKYKEGNEYKVVFCYIDEAGRRIVVSTQFIAPGHAATAPEAPERDGFVFDKWNMNVDSIRSDLEVVAQYLRKVTISFRDYDNTVIDESTVIEGTDVRVPAEPTRDGYKFNGWNISVEEEDVDGNIQLVVKNVRENMTITAQYAQFYTVEFIDENRELLDTQEVETGEAASYFEPDIIPEKHIFKGWEYNGQSYTEELPECTRNMTFTAVYRRVYEIKFAYYREIGLPGGGFNQVLEEKTTLVEEGETFSTSEIPNAKDITLSGYIFNGWDDGKGGATDTLMNLGVPEEDMTFTAKYEIRKYTVTFLMPDDTVIPCTYRDYNSETPQLITVTEQEVAYGSAAYMAEAPEMYYDWEKRTAYGFSGWYIDDDGRQLEIMSVENVTKTMRIKAKYDSPYECPVIAVQFNNIEFNKGIIVVTFWMPQGYKLYSIDLACVYFGNVSINTVEENSASPMLKGTEVKIDRVINNKAQTFTFAWANPGGTILDNNVGSAAEPIIKTFSELLYFNIKLDGGTQLSDRTFKVSEDSSMVIEKIENSSADAVKLQKVKPVVVYR